MLDVGFSEILLTSAIALIVLGPERLPKVARQFGNWMGRARAMARQLSEQLEREVSAEELLKTQSKPNIGLGPPSGGGAQPRSGAAPLLAPSTPAPNTAPALDTPDTGVAPTAGPAASAPTAAPPLPAAPAEPVYGLPASLTTPSAMHASETPATTPGIKSPP